MSRKRSQNASGAQTSSAARRKQREKALRMRLYVVMIIMVVAAVFTILVFNVFFNIQTVEVAGSTNYTADEIFAASGITVGDNMLRENTDKCSENITSQLVYVESAEVKKIYPNTVKITVEASIPFANVRTANGCLLISQGGKILEKLINPRSGIMEIEGAEADMTLEIGDRLVSVDENKTNDIYTLLEAFYTSGYETGSVTNIDITDRSDVSFVYDGRILVKLGVISDIDYKLDFVSEIVNNQIGTGLKGTLKLLPDSAQFIDEAGIDENERIFEANKANYEESLRAEETASDTDVTAEGETAGENPGTASAPSQEEPEETSETAAMGPALE